MQARKLGIAVLLLIGLIIASFVVAEMKSGLNVSKAGANTSVAYKPIIKSVNLSTYEIVNGGSLTVTVIAQSNAPVNWIMAVVMVQPLLRLEMNYGNTNGRTHSLSGIPQAITLTKESLLGMRGN